MNTGHTEDSRAFAFDHAGTGRMTPISAQARWAGYVMSAVAILFLIFDGVIKVLQLAPALETTVQLG